MRILIALCAGILPVASANAGLFINEALVSTTGADSEFIEIYNSGPGAVDLAGYFIEEIESDASNGAIGTVDDTFTIPSGVIPAGGFFLIGNNEFETAFGITPDLNLNLSVENSASTLVLNDDLGNDLYVVLLDDGDGIAQAPADITVGPDGSFLPAGFYLDTDGGSTASLLEFAPKPAPTATPGFSNVVVPEPTAVALALLSVAAVAGRKRG